jgi:hypothetical protein
MQSRPPNHPRNRWTHCNSPSALIEAALLKAHKLRPPRAP